MSTGCSYSPQVQRLLHIAGVLSCSAAVLLAAGTSTSIAGPFDDAAVRAAGSLTANQQQPEGHWDEFSFTGESVTGLASVYRLTGMAPYRAAAEAGGNYCLDDSGYDSAAHTYMYELFGGGAYALTRLSEISGNPASNSWRTAVEDFYVQITTGVGGTQGFIDTAFLNDPTIPVPDSSAVYDVARHAVAAFYVGASERGTWRSGLISALGDIDTGDDSQVMALAVAVWGLAQTGVMDGTMVSTDSASYFNGITLSQLPGMLAGHQAPDGSFYTMFDHGLGSGFTETTAMGALGLIATNASSAYDDEIFNAKEALAGGVDAGGDVWWEIGNTSSFRQYYLAGETLEVLPEPGTLCLLNVLGMVLLTRRRARQSRPRPDAKAKSI